MILTCPACATRYFVGDAMIGPGGRKVRCSGCRAVWRAEPAADPIRPPLPFDTPPEIASFRPGRPARRAPGWRKPALIAAGVIVALAGAAWLFRTELVRAWPSLDAAYVAVGLGAP